MLQSGSESVVVFANYFFAVKIYERHCEARHAYMTIHLAVKTIHPQISCQFVVVQLTVKVVKLKERTAKIQLFSLPRKGTVKKVVVEQAFECMSFLCWLL